MLGVCWTSGVRAQDDQTSSRDAGAASRSAEAGMFLPLSMAPRTDSQTAFLNSYGGYDSARRAAEIQGTADVTLFGPLALRGGAQYTEFTNRTKPTLGLRLQPLSQQQHGIDGGVGVFYKPEGLTEAEGEVEAVVMLSRRFGRLTGFANLVYGQDPEGAERDGEVRLAGLYRFTAELQAGLDGRVRFDLGSDAGKRRAKLEAAFDLTTGPTLSYSFGRVAAFALAGLSAVNVSGMRLGAIALGGLGGSL
jgi:hypothetical protein